jgi:peptidoglycan-associated lipoprotein
MAFATVPVIAETMRALDQCHAHSCVPWVGAGTIFRRPVIEERIACMCGRPVLVCVALLLSACTSAPEQPAPAPVLPPETRAVEPSPPPETDGERQGRAIRELSSKSIYFDSNSYVIKSEYRETIKQVAEFLASAPQVSISLVGNGDLGGKTYRPLGQKRADSVKGALKELGIAESRTEAIGLATPKQRTACRDKKCLAENRRVDFVFRAPETAK